MNKNSIKKNYIYNLLYQIILVLTPLITTPYLSRVILASGVGEVSFTESVVSYFVLFANLGIATYGQREISYFQNNLIKRSEVFYNVFILKLLISSIVFMVYVIFYLLVYKSYLYLVFSFSILAVLIDVTWFFQGLEEFKLVTIRNLIFRFLNIVLILILVKNRDDIIKYCFIVSFTTLLSNISLLPYLKKYLAPINKKSISPFSNFNVVLSLFLPTVAIQIYTVLDKTMIGLITNDVLENGYYEQSSKISKFLLFIVTALGTVVIPRIGYYYNQKDDYNLKKIIYKSYRWTLLLSIPMSIGLFVLSDNFIPWFLGVEFYKSIFLTKILSLLLIIIGLSNVTGLQYMVPTGKQKLLTISLCIGALVNFSLNFILIRYYKSSVGAAIASVLAEFLITSAQFYFVKNEISVLKIFKESVNYLIASAFMLIIIIVVKNYF